MLKLLVSVGLVAVVSSRKVWGPMPRYHRRGMPLVNSEISLEVPPADQRDPEKCELYENENYMDHGCQRSCSVSGFFGNFRVQDIHPRTVSQCKAFGSFCRMPIITHDQINVTYSNGRCNSACRCVPAPQNENYLRTQLTELVGALMSTKRHNRSHHRVNNGHNRFGAVRLHIPANELRNQTACEDYESSYFAYQVVSAYQCKQVCTLNGNLGGLQFEGKPRVLKDNQSDGTYCELSSHGEGKISLKGVEQVVSGMCKKGICRPHGWVDPSETTTAAPTTSAPTRAVATSVADATATFTAVKSDFVKKIKRVEEISNEISIGTGRLEI